MKNIIVIAAIMLCLLGTSLPAQAQLYSWRDENGIMVVSDHPKGGQTGGRGIVVAKVSPVAPMLLNTIGNYEPIIRQHSYLQNVRADLVRAVIQVESAFNPRALSPKGAMGLMQLMPSVVAQFRVFDPFNPAENIRAGVAYLRQLLTRYDDNEELALAAYNAGPMAVDRHGTRVPPYTETRNYVKRITAVRATTRNAPGSTIYKQVEFVDGHPVMRYSNTKPASGDYQAVK